MLRTVLTSFVALCLLIAPIAHAAGLDCKAVQTVKMESAKEFAKKDSNSSEKQQDGDQSGKLAHHCCTYFSAKLDVSLTAQQWVSSKVAFPLENEIIGSVVLGPPLKPPSHA